MIQKAVTVETLSQAIKALHKQGVLTDLPAVSTLEMEDALRQSRIGGFVQQRKRGFMEGWQLSHEILGQWFCEQHGLEDLSKLRLSLVPFGAVPLPEKASEAEFGQWLEWVKEEDYEHYQSLAPELQVSICDSLLAHLPEKEVDRALVLARLSFVFLSGTGEKRRGFALEPRLEQTLPQSNLSPLAAILQNRYELAAILIRIGEVYRDQNKTDLALKYFKHSLVLSEQLLSESPTPQNHRDVAITLQDRDRD
ncbi:tetratricopeptide repeat protein [Candidatus Marithioploca araucensis]|uniref:Tetratricopeptide repeat protein n=1 Tax=Candidatus Marithioploca araucensis TaxID=70273 RepID=A0ABT7VTK8_9GAMM|nr:tetratricopeptide repeat protein [Candidatus Marithioploca araucensis]